MRRAVVGGLVVLLLVASWAVLSTGRARAAVAPPFVSLLIGRSMFAQSEGCRAIGPDLYALAARFAQRGVRATGVVVPSRTPETGVACASGNLYPAWSDLARLRDEFGWSFVSNGQQYLDITTLTPPQRVAESCGSLAAFERHGHNRAWGMYGPGSNNITDAIARNPVGTCFGFTRLYDGTSVNRRANAGVAPWYARTNDTNGGRCNVTPCTGTPSLTKRYMLPSVITSWLAQAQPDTWILLSTYKQVEGAKLSGGRRWDCTSSDPRKHWTTEVESYCLVDLLQALEAIPNGARVVDPATVTQAWGRPIGPPGSTTTTSSTTPTTTTRPSPGSADRSAYWGYLWADGTLQPNGSYFFTQDPYRSAASYDRFARGATANGITVALNSNGNYYSVTPRPHPAIPDMTNRPLEEVGAFVAAVIESEGACSGLVEDGARAGVDYIQRLLTRLGIPSTIRTVSATFSELRVAPADFPLLQALPYATTFRTPGAPGCTVETPSP